jgi:serine/threonine-protein kinase
MSAPFEPQLLPGTSLRLLFKLGEGAHGVVYVAQQESLGRQVVVKLLREDYSKRADIVDRLRLEAQAIAAIGPLTHHVVSVLDHGRAADGRAFIVMERLEGRTLGRELKMRPALPVAEAVDIACQILDGLVAAHAAGVIHRDIKPDNVFLAASSGGRVVKLLDFGIAKVVADARRQGGVSPLVLPTATGTMLGSPRWFSPEQARGERVTERSDLYAVAGVLYAMLAGRSPFQHHGNVLDLTNAHLFEMPAPPSAHASQPIPEAIDEAVMRGLAKRPEDRFESAAAFRSVLSEATRPRKRWLVTERMVDGTAPLPAPSRPEQAPPGRPEQAPLQPRESAPISLPLTWGSPSWSLGKLFAVVLAASLFLSASITATVLLRRPPRSRSTPPPAVSTAPATAEPLPPLPEPSAPAAAEPPQPPPAGEPVRAPEPEAPPAAAPAATSRLDAPASPHRAAPRAHAVTAPRPASPPSGSARAPTSHRVFGVEP